MDRKHDLDYLQWLQQNARVYLTAMTILTFFVVFTFCVCFYQPWQPQQSVAFWRQDDSDQAVAEQQVPEQSAAKQQQTDGQQAAPQNRDAQAELQTAQAVEAQQPKPAAQSNQPKAEAESRPEQTQQDRQQTAESTAEQTARPQHVDPLSLESKLAAFAAPCSGTLLYNYGVGYDARYGDYRFHDAVCYQADGDAVLAMSDGVVQQLDMNQLWQLTVQCGSYTLRYQGLQNCTVAVGDAVTAGQAIGTAGDLLYVQALEQ